VERIYIGLDLHRKYSQVAVMDSSGRVLEEGRLENEREEIEGYFSGLSGEVKVAVEATGNWYWLVDLLESCGCEVWLAHPKNVKAIASAKIKTDKIDARVLGHLLRTDYLPTAYIPSVAVRDRRELLRYRCFLVRHRTSLKNRLHSLIAKRGISHPFSDLFGKAGREWLCQLELPDIYLEEIEGIMEIIDQLEMKVKGLEKKIRERVEEDHLALLLLSVPGVGYFSSLLILAEIADIDRFCDAKHLCSYAGLVPSVHSSGGKTRYGRITKEGSGWLRWVLIQAVPKAIKKDPHLQRYYQDLTKKHGKKIAKVAVARKLLKSIYHMLKRKEPYNPFYPERRLRVRVSS